MQSVRTDCITRPDLSRSTRAQGQPGPAGRAPPPDPRRRAGLFRPLRVRGRHRTPARRRDRPVPGGHLPPLPGQGLPLPGGRRGRRGRHGGDGGAQRPGPGHVGPARPGRPPRRRLAGSAPNWRCPGGSAPIPSSRSGGPPGPRRSPRATRERLERQRAAGVLRDDVPVEVLAQFLELAYDGLVRHLAMGGPTEQLGPVLDLVESTVRRR